MPKRRTRNWWETHLYTYGVALAFGGWTSANLAKLRAKVIRTGHTEGECLCVERDPMRYVNTGKFA